MDKDTAIREVELLQNGAAANGHESTAEALGMAAEALKIDKDTVRAVAVYHFINEIGEMAEKNWCQSQVKTLQRLIAAVIKGKAYDEVELE